MGVRKAGNAGLVTTTGGNDLTHTMPTGRTGKIVKILAYNNTGANVTLQFGTLDRATPASTTCGRRMNCHLWSSLLIPPPGPMVELGMYMSSLRLLAWSLPSKLKKRVRNEEVSDG